MEIFLIILALVLIIGPIYIYSNLKKVQATEKKIGWHRSQEYTTLRIDVPKNNEKQPLAAEQMFASIHGIYSESAEYQSHLSFEIVAKDKFIQFYICVPKHLRDFVEGQVYAQYPTVEINEVLDYAGEIDFAHLKAATCEITLNKPDVYPIKSFTDFEVDPLSGITSVMSKLEPGEQVWFQLIIRPVGDEWQDKGNKIVSAVRSGKSPEGQSMSEYLKGGASKFGKMFFHQVMRPGEEMTEETKEVNLPATVEEALKGIEQKITKLGFSTTMRLLAISGDVTTSRLRCQSVAAAFKQFNTTNLNGFKVGEVIENDKETISQYIERSFEEEGSILNINELASVYHLPHKSVETPNIVWSGSKKGEPPANLPLRDNTEAKSLTVIGETTFRNIYRPFGIKLDDRRRHVYIVGKSGTGKSVLIENMAVDDVVEGRGVMIIDPHGELADKVISVVPEDRVNDVIVFDPSDRSFPIAFNLLEKVDDDFKGMVASGFVGIFKKIFGDSWGPRLEHILRNTVLALLDYPDSTMLDIPKMLTESRFRTKVIEIVKDPVIRDFWVNEFEQYDSKFRTEAVSPILNKVGQFLSTATIRNIVGQPHSKIDIRKIMDEKKILVVNLSRGKIGEDNSALLGAMMVTKIQLAAMSRADVPVEERPDCYLYVDEFQNFATESFAVILAEARKYNLCLTMANQYIAQMTEEVREAVFGNAGTIITFRVGGTDADHLVKEFAPVFDENDLVNQDKYHIYIKLLVEGIASPAFSARTFPPVQITTESNREKIIETSRSKYSNPRNEVEEDIRKWAQQEEEDLRKEAEAFRQGGLGALKQNNYYNNNNTFTPAPRASAASPEASNHSPVNSGAGGEVPKENIEENPVHEEKEKKDRPRVLKYKNIIGDKIYKEQTGRGGVKWYIGEDIDLDKMKELGVEVPGEAEKMIDLAKKVDDNGGIEPKVKASDNQKKIESKEDSNTEKKPEETKNNSTVLKSGGTDSNQDVQASVSGSNTGAQHINEGEEIKLHHTDN